jgi:hypothetical protein
MLTVATTSKPVSRRASPSRSCRATGYTGPLHRRYGRRCSGDQRGPTFVQSDEESRESGSRFRVRFAPPAEFRPTDCSPYRGPHVRRERLGFAPTTAQHQRGDPPPSERCRLPGLRRRSPPTTARRSGCRCAGTRLPKPAKFIRGFGRGLRTGSLKTLSLKIDSAGTRRCGPGASA